MVAYFPFDEDFDDKAGGYSPKKPLVFVKGVAGSFTNGAVGRAWNVSLNPLANASIPDLGDVQFIQTPFNVSFFANTARAQTASPATIGSTAFINESHNSLIFPYMSSGQSGGGIGFAVGKNNISVYAHRGDYFGRPLSFDTDFTGNRFHHYSLNFVKDGKIVLFIDGKRMHEAVGQAGYTFLPIYFGGGARGPEWEYNDYHRFDGLIDEVRIYNRVLNDKEVQELYDLRKNG